MNPEDRFDDLIKERLRASAPNEAPARVLEGTMTRISETSQRGRGWFGGTPGRLLAAAAVLLVAIVAGTQLAGIINRPVGTSQTPLPSATETPEPSSAVPSATAAPSPSPTDAEANGLLLRIVAGGGGPTSPIDQVPWVSIMDDGSVVWSPAPTGPEVETLLVRQLTPDGLADLTAVIFDSGLLSEDATYELERRPGAPEPPGRGVVVYEFTSGIGDDLATITSVQWLGDDEEETYYQPSLSGARSMGWLEPCGTPSRWSTRTPGKVRPSRTSPPTTSSCSCRSPIARPTGTRTSPICRSPTTARSRSSEWTPQARASP